MIKKAAGIPANFFYYLILSAFFILFFYPLFSVKNALLNGDYGAQVYPWLSWYADALKHAKLPLWTDKIQCGFPLFAEGQTAMLYLPQVVLLGLLPFKIAYNALFVAHYLAAGIFFYLFCRNRKLSVEAAIFAVMVYLFGSTSGGGFYGIFSLRPLVWFPLALLCADKMTEEGSWTAFFLLVFAQSQMWVAGYPQMAAYGALFSVLYVLTGFLGKQLPTKMLVPIAAAVLIAVAMGLVQLLPTLQLGAHSTRLLQDKDFFLWGSLPPWSFPALWMYKTGDIFQVNLYLGVFTLLLVIAGSHWKSLEREWVLAGLAFFLALGQWNPLFRLLARWEIFSLLRAPSKFIFFAQFFLIVIAASALDRVLEDEFAAQRFFQRALNVFAFILAVFCAVAIFLKTSADRVVVFGDTYVRRFILNKSFHRKAPGEYFEKVRHIFSTLQTHFAWNSTSFWVPCGIAVVMLFIFYFVYLKNRNRSLCIVLLLACLGLDLWIYGIATPGTSWRGNVSSYAELPSVDHRPSDGRWLKAPMSLGLPQAGAYSPLLDKDYYLLMKDFGVLDDSFGVSAPVPENTRNAGPLLDFLGIKYLPALNPSAMPSQNYVSRVKSIADPVERILYLKSGRFDPRQEVVLEEPLTGNFLVWNEVSDPGWSAMVDGQPAKIVKADQAFMAVQVPAGAHDVKFRYKPLFFVPGILIYGFGVLICLGGAVFFSLKPKGALK